MQDEGDEGTKRPSTASTGSSIIDAKFTLNPEDKFLALNPPKAALKVPRHARSTPTMGGCHSTSAGGCVCPHPQNHNNSTPSKVTFDLPTSPRQLARSASNGRKASPISAPVTRRPSLWNMFRRDSRSADETKLETHEIWQLHEHFGKLGNPQISSRAGRVTTSDTCDTSGAQRCLHEMSLTSDLSPPDRPQSRIDSGPLLLEAAQRESELCMRAEEHGLTQGADSPDGERPEPSDFTLNLRTQLDRLAIQPVSYTGNTILLNKQEITTASQRNSAVTKSQPLSLRDSLQMQVAPVQHPSFVGLDSEVQASFQPAGTDSSYASSHGFSPTWSSTAFTEIFSPIQGAQVASPTVSDFGDYLAEFDRATSFSTELFASLRPSTAKDEPDPLNHKDTGELNVYQLPEADGSVLTLRDLPRAKHKFGAARPFDAKNGNDLVEAWNDGAQGIKTTFEEFFHDHSYLSTVIL